MTLIKRKKSGINVINDEAAAKLIQIRKEMKTHKDEIRKLKEEEVGLRVAICKEMKNKKIISAVGYDMTKSAPVHGDRWPEFEARYIASPSKGCTPFVQFHLR